jgi:hypothetical protein
VLVAFAPLSDKFNNFCELLAAAVDVDDKLSALFDDKLFQLHVCA